MRVSVMSIPFDSSKTEAQSGKVICLRSSHWYVVQQDWNPDSAASELRTQIWGTPSPFYDIAIAYSLKICVSNEAGIG